jgi:imidazolonepropionase-like amidohydrolase
MLLFDTADELTALRALDIAEELRLRVVLLGSGLEFRRLEALAQRKPAIVVPLSFPKKPDVSSIGAAEGTDLRDLMAWEHGPTNPRVLIASRKSLEGLALTTARIPRGKFKDRLAKAIEHGLMPDEALAMLTTGPASILGVADRLGTVEAGKIADLVVVDGPPLGEHTRVRQVFVGGRPHEILAERLRGVWSVTLEPPIPEPITLTFRDEEDLEIRSGEDTGPAKSVKIEGEHLRVLFDHEPFGEAGVMVLSGRVRGDRIEGEGERPDGKRFRWTATRTSRTPPEKKEADEDDWPRPLKPPRPRHPGYPFGPYAVRPGSTSPPGILVRAGTLWTSGPAGTLENAFLVAKGSHLVYVGTDEAAARAAAKGIEGLVEIDASDKHVTPGILDGHSHTGISHDVNESGQTVSAEVRIQDVTDPDDPNWYRQLAGGVTTVLTLHGSANPIGGQSQVQKLRWGVVEPREMHFEGAMPGIKFALGENVKQSNWGDEHKTRYPQTRMGVETLIRDRFAAAREYAAAERGVDSRRDLELEALAEVLAGKRLVHCHAYRQDEMVMLCRLAEEFGFRLGTFQHALEAYKIADVLKEHGVGVSVFSDWWAYKVEVQDAIPFNTALCHRVGVVTSVNSDSADLARRLTTEAAKAMKYGGLSAEEALALVTILPARQLRIDERIGSLESGKDADFAIWSGPPLSTLSRCEATWVDGIERFSIERDREHRARIAAERHRLIQKARAAPDEPDDGDDGPGGDERWRGGGDRSGHREGRCHRCR